MKENASKKRILPLILVAAITIAALVYIVGVSFKNDSAKPVNGVLDMKGWDAENDSILNLRGEWEFYWNSFVTYQDITNNSAIPDLTVNAPSVWNGYKIAGKNLTGFGYGTYRLKVVNALAGQPLAFRLPAFATSYELYIDDLLLAHDGEADKDEEHSAPGCKPRVAEFTPAGQSFEIIIHISNFSYAQGGMCYPVRLGSAEQIQRADKTIADQDLFLFGGLCIMAFYFLCIFSMRREDKCALYFVLACVLLAGSTAISGDLLIFRLFPRISYEAIIKMMYIVICWFPVCVAFATGELFPEERSNIIQRIAFIYAAIMTPLILFTSVSVYSQLVTAVTAAHFLIDCYFIAILTRAYIRRRDNALFLLLGSVGVMLCYAHEMLYYSGAGKLASLIILLMQSFALAKRFTESFRIEKELSQKAAAAEVAFMQAQIKPHFLYNTLSTISSFCDTDPAHAGRLIDNFADYLRRSFDFKSLETITSLERELNLVNSYASIEKARFGDELSVLFDIDNTINTKVPVLSIQPLVENAITHGLRKKSGGGTVTLSIQKAGGGTRFSVTDDGQGISKERVKSLLLPEDEVGIGLWNIDKRLKTLYGKGLVIESVIGKGTVVSFVIPEEAD